MAEIYTSSVSTSQGHLSPDTSDHINSVLSDLGLGGTRTDSSAPSSASAEPVQTSSLDTAHLAGQGVETAAGHEQAGAILTSSAPASTTPVADTGGTAASSAFDTSHTAAAPAAMAGADSLPGSHAGYAADTFGLGTDTLWGSGGDPHALTAAAQAPAGGDTIRSSGGMETIYGGNATIYASGHSATLSTDTVHASGEGTTMDGSASSQALHTDGGGSFDHLPGGSGSDTVVLHDATGTTAAHAQGTADDGHATSAAAIHDPYGTGTHDATWLGTGSTDSVIGGDGSDPFAGYGYGYDLGGATYADDGTSAHDPYLTGGTVTHSDAGTFVSYHDGYDAGYAGSDHLPFKDTVMAG